MQERTLDAPPPPLSPLVLWDAREGLKTGMACLPLFCVSADCSCQEAHLTAFEVDDRFQGIVRRGNEVELEFRDDGSGRPRPRTRGVMAVIDLSTGRATVDAEAPRKSQDPELFGRLHALLDEAAIADLKDRWERFKEERRREAWDKRDWTDWDGEDLYWQDVAAEATPDLYLLDGITYEALDHYCADPDCDCQECGVDFFPLPDGARDEVVGTVLVEATTGEVVGTRNLPGRRGLLDRLWTAFSSRHDPALMAHRWNRIREIAPRLHELRSEQLRPEPIRRETRAGRNDPCPCGSGRKYKRCCL